MWLMRVQNKRKIIPWMLFALSVTVLTGILPAVRIFLFGYAVQQVISGVNVDQLLMLMAWFAAATIGEKVMDSLYGVALEGLRIHIGRSAKELYVDRYNEVPYQQLLNRSFSESAEKAANGLDRGHRILTLGLDVLSAGIMLISLGTALWFVTKIGCLVMIVTFAFVVFKQYKLGRQMFNVENQLSGQRIRENYYRSTIMDVHLGKERKLFGYSPYIVNLWRNTFTEISKTNQTFLLTSQKTTGVMQIGQLLLISVAYMVSILTASSSIGGLIIAFQLIDELLGKANAFVLELRLFTSELLVSSNLTRFLSAEAVIKTEDSTKEAGREVALNGVSFTYPNSDRPVITDVNMHFRTGELIGLVGENGAGKTTLCNIMCGLLEPTEGEVWMDGEHSTPADRLRAISVAYADFSRFPLNVQQNIGLNHEWNDAAQLLVQDIIHRSGDKRLGAGYSDGTELSGGQWQRVAVARAMANTKNILVLDEPTAAMDPVMEEVVVRSIKQFVTQGKAALLIAHRVSTVMHCDKVYVMADGQIVQEGNPLRLLEEDGVFREMYGAQVALLRKQGSVASVG
ncbi:ABC transporter ATP-binding protein/permease [Paenibacillus sp. LS1]|uniref:ATP-binding cassette domain-containing protein n=1 Tax=Paenibacillus sp. LS1 TaxID=2992120 RepID=UPI0022307547|nr:ABC transporter ATP-binding protein [Paenibacillus sp. LS1]MCW3795137.1 ABC transporter ATP-binding protein/permease [Paenibacillus sp. LS1]